MAVQTVRAPSTGPSVTARFAPAEPGSAQPFRIDPAARSANRSTREPMPRKHQGVRVAVSAMGWVLWTLLALVMAAFLAFAPSVL